jgi:hypothetical protein
VTAVGALLSLPPPPSSLPPLSLTSSSMSPAISRDDLREPSLPPPPGEAIDPLSTLYPPRLSLAPLPVEPTSAPSPLLVPGVPPLSLATEALELDLSVLGPSELPDESGLPVEPVPVVELDVVELDEVRLSGEPQAPRRVAPPLPPPVLRRAR